jgi:hypothetical protein
MASSHEKNGELDWLPASGGEEHSYTEFMASVDALVIGRKAFETVLSFDAWPYGEKPVIVLSAKPSELTAPDGAICDMMTGTPNEILSEWPGSERIFSPRSAAYEIEDVSRRHIMSIYQRSAASGVRSRLREFIKTLSGAPPTPEENRIRLEFVLRARSELAAGHGDLLRLLGASGAADTLGDPERIAAYAESLAAEATISEAAGQTERADAIRRHAVAIAREAQRRTPTPDADVDQLIARSGRLTQSEDATGHA